VPPNPSPPLAAAPEPGLLARGFENRSGRIIALTRLTLATVFFIALWIDPGQPVRSTTAGYLVLFGYIVVAAAMCAVAWRSWWWDHCLAKPVHVLDVVAFLAAVFFTETTSDDFTSPFLAFFAFLILSATIRWGWRMAVGTAFAATLLYLLVGLGMGWAGIELDRMRFGRRLVYMTVLSMILIWLGYQRRGPRIARFVETPGSADERLPPLRDAVRYAMAESGAQQGAIAWADHEEPQIELRVVGLGCGNGRLAPGDLPGETPFAANARLFDMKRGRMLVPGPGGNAVAVQGPVEDALAVYCGISEGLALPFDAATGQGVVLLAEIPGASADHVATAREIAREIGSGFDRHSSLALVREGALSRMRDAVARDLHDTIAQSLAGVALRLEGLRRWIADGGDAETEIQSIKASLKTEQAQVRAMISRLRRGEHILPDSPAGATIGPLLDDLSVYWGVDARLVPGSEAIAVPGWLGHELRQLVREAVANAVRHGMASQVLVELEEREGALHVTIADNGSGMSDRTQVRRPKSISERVGQLSGEFELASGSSGTTLHLALPLEAER
jgi:signal transduction histidine kinase